MNDEGKQTLEDFFKLFHEPFSTWVVDLEAIRAKELEKGPSSVNRDEVILHFASLIERLAALLSEEFLENFSLPLPHEIWSAQILREHFREMNEIARYLLMQTGSKLKPETIKKLEWLAELSLDSVIRRGRK